jgi:putative ABC transport system substrate-binding protein
VRHGGAGLNYQFPPPGVSLSFGATTRRRDFIKVVAGSTSAWSFGAYAQPSAIPVVGVLHGVAAAQWADRMVGFHKGLGEAGFMAGRNVAIEYRWAEGQFDRLPAMAADLVNRKVAVILAGAGDVAIRAAMAATKTIPVVFTTASDPVRAGFVSSFRRPAGNLTGITFMGVDLVAKRMELPHEILPGATRIALLVNPNNPGLMQDNIQLSKAAVDGLGLEMIVIKAGGEGEIEDAVLAAECPPSGIKRRFLQLTSMFVIGPERRCAGDRITSGIEG